MQHKQLKTKKFNIKQFEIKQLRTASFIILTILFIVMLTASVSALKIAPAAKNYNIETMNSQETYVISILQSDGDITYSLSSKNKDLLKFVTLDKKGDKIFVTLNKPTNLEEGNNIIDIFVKETNDQEGMFTGNIILKSKLNIIKPITGAHLETDYVIQNNDFDDPVIFTISLYNTGSVKTDAFGTVQVTDSSTKEEVLLDEVTLEVNQKGKVANTWSHNLRRGSYDSLATLYYAGQVKEYEKSFKIGKPTMLFKKVWIDKYDPEGITRINAIVEFDWNIGKNISLKSGDVVREGYFSGYEDKEFQFFSENQDITISAYEGNNLLNSYEVDFQDLVNDYKHKKLIKLIIWTVILLLLLLLVLIWWFTIKK